MSDCPHTESLSPWVPAVEVERPLLCPVSHEHVPTHTWALEPTFGQEMLAHRFPVAVSILSLPSPCCLLLSFLLLLVLSIIHLPWLSPPLLSPLPSFHASLSLSFLSLVTSFHRFSSLLLLRDTAFYSWGWPEAPQDLCQSANNVCRIVHCSEVLG